MEKRRVPGTDLMLSRLCFGNMTFGGQTDYAAAERMINFCLDRGIDFLDTANVYNKGAAEEMLGRTLEGRRGRVVLATKVRGVMGPGPDESGLSRAAILKAVDDSLRRLRTDYIDIYYFHAPDYATPLEESMDAMEQLIRQGKVRYPAVSNYAAWQVCRMHWLADVRGYEPTRIAQMIYNLMARGIEQEFLPLASDAGVATVVYNPLAGGMLTGKQQPGAPLPGTRFDGNKLYLDRYWHPDFFAAVEELKAAAAAAGRTLVSLSLNWLLHHTPVKSIILGASRLAQLELNLAACEEGPLDELTVKRCDEIWARLRGVTPRYNR